MYKGLIGISPSGSGTFVSDLYSGSISDEVLTWRYDLLDLVEPGDSVMWDRGFDIKEDLQLVVVFLNILSFFPGKQQFDNVDFIETRRIASLGMYYLF